MPIKKRTPKKSAAALPQPTALTPPSAQKRIRVWRKLASAKWADAWEERLRHVGLHRLAILLLPGGRSLRLEIYDVSATEAQALTKSFGGETRMLPPQSWVPRPAAKARPILIRDRLVLVPDPAAAPAAAKSYPGRIHLVIPAAMAFGTGEHPTTATCLRFLCDHRELLEKGRFMDLGTGSGVLALAATRLGAAHSTGIDFDPDAVRTAKANALANQDRKTKFLRADVLEWKPGAPFDIIAANLFSELLIRLAPRLANAIRPGGVLLLSGTLRSQEVETLAVFRKAGFRCDRVVRRGKWIGASLSTPPTKP